MSTSGPAARTHEHRFWLAIVATLAILVFWGFGGSFFLRGILPPRPSYIDGAARLPFVLHGLAFGAWMLLLTIQVGLVASGNTRRHRQLGQSSLVLLPILAITGIAVTLHAGRHGFHDMPIPTAVFLTVPVLGLGFFLVVTVLALLLRHRPAAHKRLMVIATMMVAGAGTTRIPEVVATVPPGFDPTQLLIVPMLWWDWRSLGRVHPATLWGGIALVITNSVAVPIGFTPGWQALVAPISG